MKRTSPAISRGVDTLHGSRREIGRGKQAHCSCTKIRVTASELEEGTGHPVSWTSIQSVEVGAGSGSMSWS